MGQAIGVAISLLFLWLTFRQVDIEEASEALRDIEWKYIALGVISLAVGYAVRVQRWAVMLRASGARIRSLSCSAAFLGSMALNNTLPFRAGDVVRALIFPNAINVSRSSATASLLLERLADLVILLSGLGACLWISSMIELPEWLLNSILSVSALAGFVLILFFLVDSIVYRFAISARSLFEERKFQLLTRATGALITVVDALRQMTRFRVLPHLLLLSVLAWVAEAGLFWLFMIGMDIEPHRFSFAILVMTIAALSTLIPSSPGYIGPFHFAISSTLLLAGVSSGQAASYAVLTHLGIWLPTTVAGWLILMFNPGLFRKFRQASSDTSTA